jgi:hypothetical protein
LQIPKGFSLAIPTAKGEVKKNIQLEEERRDHAEKHKSLALSKHKDKESVKESASEDFVIEESPRSSRSTSSDVVVKPTIMPVMAIKRDKGSFAKITQQTPPPKQTLKPTDIIRHSSSCFQQLIVGRLVIKGKDLPKMDTFGLSGI